MGDWIMSIKPEAAIKAEQHGLRLTQHSETHWSLSRADDPKGWLVNLYPTTYRIVQGVCRPPLPSDAARALGLLNGTRWSIVDVVSRVVANLPPIIEGEKGNLTAKPKYGAKYIRKVRSVDGNGYVMADAYCIIDACNVKRSAVAHAIKKLLYAGQRGKNDELADLKEAREALDRAIIQVEQEEASSGDAAR